MHAKFGGNGASYGISDADCSYMFPGDSDPWHWGTYGIVPEGFEDYVWTEVTAGNSPSDRRGVGSCGPFTFSPSEQGKHQELDVAYVTGWGTETVQQSVEELQNHASHIRRQFNSLVTDSGRPFVYQPFTVGIEEADEDASVSIYPNPTNGMLHVTTPSAGLAIDLFDMMGRRCMSVTSKDSTTIIDLSSIPQGVYILRTAGISKRIVRL